MAFLSAKPENINFDTDNVGRLLFKLSLPPVTVSLIASIVNFFSGAIVASVSIDYLTAYTICNPFCSALVSSMYVGVMNGSSSLTGRNLTDKNAVNKVIFNSMLLLSFFMLIYVLIAIFFAMPFLRLFTSDEKILNIGIKFIYIYAFASILTGYSQTIISILQSLGDTTVTSVFSLVSIPITFILNLITVNGYLGLPKMGLYGIAVTAIFMSIVNLSFGIIRLNIQGFGIFKNREISKSYLKQIFIIAIPSMLQQFLATTLVSGYNLVIKGISESAVAVMGVFYNWISIVQSLNLRFSLFSIIGSNLALGRKDRLIKTIRYSVGYAFFIGTAFTLFFLFFTKECLDIFNYPSEQIAQGTYIFRILGIYTLPMILFTVLNHLAIALGNSRTGFVALVVQTAITLIGGFTFSNTSTTLSLVSFSFAAIAALIAVLVMIYNSKSAELKMIKDAFRK